MKKKRKISSAAGVVLLGLSVTGGVAGCGSSGGGSPTESAPSGIEPKLVADMLHAVMAADRKVYVKNVVNRLTKDQEVMVSVDGKEPVKFHGSEDWETTPGTLPLPAQQFRYGSEEAMRDNDTFEYGLISSWAINKKHMPDTEWEKVNIKTMEEKGEPVYGEEEVAGQKYFVAMYPDRATAKACWDCHNKHPDSPRNDFEQDEVMGGIVIRIPL